MIDATAIASPLLAPASAQLLRHVRELADRGLARMLLPGEPMFAFRLRREEDGIQQEGRSYRYSAIVLIGLAEEPDEALMRKRLGGLDPRALHANLVAGLPRVESLGDAALALWAGRALGGCDFEPALGRLMELNPLGAPHPTVELAWVLAALSVGEGFAREATLRSAVADRLLSCFSDKSGVFPHVVGESGGVRGHVACFADQVYPIHALSNFARITGDRRALAAARRCGEQICAVMGDAGQWWWHYDARTGRVLEGYPVYSVHQESMGPLALLALMDAGGGDFVAPLERGLNWMRAAPELGGGSLIDDAQDIVWRKVARREPRKLVRKLQATLSRAHSALRLPGANTLFPPGKIDYERRPYELGWILYAWSPARMRAYAGESAR